MCAWYEFLWSQASVPSLRPQGTKLDGRLLSAMYDRARSERLGYDIEAVLPPHRERGREKDQPHLKLRIHQVHGQLLRNIVYPLIVWNSLASYISRNRLCAYCFACAFSAPSQFISFQTSTACSARCAKPKWRPANRKCTNECVAVSCDKKKRKLEARCDAEETMSLT